MRMTSIYRRGCLLLAILCLLLSASSCKSKGSNIHDGTQEGLVFRDDSTGIEYVNCNILAVKPLSMSDEPYCKAAGISYYAIDFEDPSRFLCDYDKETGSSFVYRNRELPDITIENFNAIAAFLYIDGVQPQRVAQLYADDEYLPDELKGLNPSQDTALVRQITDALVNGEERVVGQGESSDEDVFFFRLLSADYPGLYYSVCFFGDIYGRYYVQDLANFRTVDAPAEIVAWIVG
ncbi:MAG: hypothetical protein J1E00_08385 [Oscillospiraceae bacterium]|nr:hypothetical protein [Oscillospiraceae bacterium]